MDSEKLSSSNQEQAVASWVNYLNQLRLDTLLESLRLQDRNLHQAVATIDAALEKIATKVISTNRGGQKGVHGFIAEVAEVGVGNARQKVWGGEASYQLVDDNGPVDLIRNGLDIQLKFSAAGGRFSLGAVKEHLQRYPDFVTNGAVYQLPKDHFETIRALHSMSEEEAGKLLARSGDGPSFTQWKKVQKFFTDTSLDIDSLEPSVHEYAQVQRGAYEATLDGEKASLASTDQDLRDRAHQTSRPHAAEGMTVTAVSAAMEGGISFALAVKRKRQEGKRLKDFDEADWRHIIAEAGQGGAKGGVRGFSVYALTNHTATSAAVASSMVTASFGIAEQAHRLRAGEITEPEFIERAELLSIEASVSALSSLAGHLLIPVPVLGAVLGNTVGTLMYQTAVDALSRREQQLIQEYAEQQRLLDEQLEAEHREFLQALNQSTATFLSLIDRAFSPDVSLALQGSIELAEELGVAPEEILDTEEKTMRFFLD